MNHSDSQPKPISSTRLPVAGLLASAAALSVVFWFLTMSNSTLEDRDPGDTGAVASAAPRLDAVLAGAEHGGSDRQRFDEVGTVVEFGIRRSHVLVSVAGEEVSLRPERALPVEASVGDIVRVQGRRTGTSAFGVVYVDGTCTMVRKTAPAAVPSKARRRGDVQAASTFTSGSGPASAPKLGDVFGSPGR